MQLLQKSVSAFTVSPKKTNVFLGGSSRAPGTFQDIAMAMDQPLDEETFERLVAQTRLHERGRQVARAVLVQGKRPAEVGPEFGVSRQAAIAATTRVLRKLQAEKGVTKDWVAATVVCSPELAKFIRYLAAYEQARAGVKEGPKIPGLSKEVIETIAEVLRQWAKS